MAGPSGGGGGGATGNHEVWPVPIHVYNISYNFKEELMRIPLTPTIDITDYVVNNTMSCILAPNSKMK